MKISNVVIGPHFISEQGLAGCIAYGVALALINTAALSGRDISK